MNRSGAKKTLAFFLRLFPKIVLRTSEGKHVTCRTKRKKGWIYMYACKPLKSKTSKDVLTVEWENETHVCTFKTSRGTYLNVDEQNRVFENETSKEQFFMELIAEKLTIRSLSSGTYMSVDSEDNVVCRSKIASNNEMFELGIKVALKVSETQRFVTANSQNVLLNTKKRIGDWEQFYINFEGENRCSVSTAHHKFWKAEPKGSVHGGAKTRSSDTTFTVEYNGDAFCLKTRFGCYIRLVEGKQFVADKVEVTDASRFIFVFSNEKDDFLRSQNAPDFDDDLRELMENAKEKNTLRKRMRNTINHMELISAAKQKENIFFQSELLQGEEWLLRMDGIGWITLERTIIGSLLITNYQTVFRASRTLNDPSAIQKKSEKEWKVPLASIEHIVKTGDVGGALGEFFGFTLICKDFYVFRLCTTPLTATESDQVPSGDEVFQLLEERIFPDDPERLFAFIHKCPNSPISLSVVISPRSQSVQSPRSGQPLNSPSSPKLPHVQLQRSLTQGQKPVSRSNSSPSPEYQVKDEETLQPARSNTQEGRLIGSPLRRTPLCDIQKDPARVHRPTLPDRSTRVQMLSNALSTSLAANNTPIQLPANPSIAVNSQTILVSTPTPATTPNPPVVLPPSKMPPLQKLKITPTKDRSASIDSGISPFFVKSQVVFTSNNEGWQIYNPLQDYQRIGFPIQNKWRISDVNKDYRLCKTYPAVLVVPSSISDRELDSVSRFRSKGRIPAIVWKHRITGAVIARCSQPRRGLKTRCNEDEKLLNLMAVSNSIQLIDARPKVNAVANALKGAGFESTSDYQNCRIKFMGIDNIHVMRHSILRLRKICLADSTSCEAVAQEVIQDSDWLDHVSSVLLAAIDIVDNVENQGTSVVVHCSDGWDRTPQLTALAQLIMDPYYRTIAGFQVLICKEWLSFGHKFGHRIGHGEPSQKYKERSPIFLQFIDCVWQIFQQHPSVFEFNEEYLKVILHHVYACRFGTFLYNSEKEREDKHLHLRTFSLWPYLLELHAKDPLQFFNPLHRWDSQDTNSNVLNIQAERSKLKFWLAYYLPHIYCK